MKKLLCSIGILTLVFLSVTNGAYALDKEELKKALNELTAEDVKDIKGTLAVKLYNSAEETGYIEDTVSVGGSGGFYVHFPSGINQNKPAGLDDITALTGGGGGFTVNMSKNWGWGIDFGGMGGFSGKKIGANYVEYSVGAFNIIPYLKYKPIITPQWIVDFDLGLGYLSGAYTNWTSNEAGTVTEISRYGSVMPIRAEIETRYRLNPIWFVGLKAGYLWASINELRRDNVVDPAAKPLDFSGSYVAIIMGGNF